MLQQRPGTRVITQDQISYAGEPGNVAPAFSSAKLREEGPQIAGAIADHLELIGPEDTSATAYIAGHTSCQMGIQQHEWPPEVLRLPEIIRFERTQVLCPENRNLVERRHVSHRVSALHAASARFHRIWNKARTAIGLPDAHFHDLRHMRNTLAAAHDASLKELTGEWVTRHLRRR
ncbi:hypothetical protein GCM10023193_11350 [Planotetraspora kaengkrachanensis]|uniref:Uncharacterized protein n=1 Tax=Planotetraspora kaengkrachanensis TaxID=575193 RepID=A0A8J3V8H6_9ACTN|nr:hypothetical protein Pka01_52790 [Planotetraspora kaengkrachanensis]